MTRRSRSVSREASAATAAPPRGAADWERIIDFPPGSREQPSRQNAALHAGTARPRGIRSKPDPKPDPRADPKPEPSAEVRSQRGSLARLAAAAAGEARLDAGAFDSDP